MLKVWAKQNLLRIPFARNLTNEDGSKRPFIEINCSTIKNNEAFFEQIFLPVIANNEVTILLDEAHALPAKT